MKKFNKKKKVNQWIGKTAVYYTGQTIKVVGDDKQCVECLESGFDFQSTVVIPKREFKKLKRS